MPETRKRAPGAGRKPVRSVPKTAFVTIRMEPATRDALLKWSAHHGQSLADFCESVLWNRIVDLERDATLDAIEQSE